MNDIVYRFDDVLNDGFNCLLLGDLYAMKAYQEDNKLDENLQASFTTTEHGDTVVKQGVMIYLAGVENEGYTVFFNFTGESQIRKFPNSKIVHQVADNLLHVVKNSISLYTWRSLGKFNQEAIDRILAFSKGEAQKENKNGITYIQNDTIRQCVPVENGYYEVEVLCGYLEDETPSFEFLFQKTQKTSLNSLPSYSYDLSSDVS